RGNGSRAPPTDSGERSNGAKSGRKACAAGTSRYVLFDIVSCAVTHARPHPKERAGRRRAAKSRARARVSKGEDGHGLPSCFGSRSADQGDRPSAAFAHPRGG